MCFSLILILAANLKLEAQSDRSAKIAEILDSLKKEIGIGNGVQITIVENNRLGMSVQPLDRHRGDFLLSIDHRFVTLLDEAELTAALAHELGHIWIYTHHPFLHTESLANQIAMRVVTRDALKKMYAKLWVFEGTPGNIIELLGAESSEQVATKRPD